MKKGVTYNVDLLIDGHGNVRITQCECAAGMGQNSHCKHIVCTVFCLVQVFVDLSSILPHGFIEVFLKEPPVDNFTKPINKPMVNSWWSLVFDHSTC